MRLFAGRLELFAILIQVLWGLGGTSVVLAQEVDLVAPTEALTAAEQQKLFRLPPGFEIQLVAAEPEIRKPMNIRFDQRGRLYATQSVEYPFPVGVDEIGRDCVKRFSDFAANGQAKTVETVLEGLNIPIGLLPVGDALYYYTIPRLYRAVDSDGDGTYENSQVMYAEFGHRDTHGMCNSFTRGLDGWLYATHGFSNTSEVVGSDGEQIVMNSGNTFRMRLDGSRAEYHTHGQVNPFGLCFDPRGNLYSSDCHTKPIYQLLRGAYYPSFGKPHDGLGFGPEMIDHLHGSTGIAGVVYYAAEQFPEEYRGAVFIGNPVTGRVNLDRLEQHGSSYRAVELPDFISCDDPWFRPVDLQLGPDGALYIADFYNRIIGHYEVPLTHPGRDRSLGRIWRVVYTGAELPQPPDFTQYDLQQLWDALGDANLTIRTMATHELVDRYGEQAGAWVSRNLPAATPWQRTHGLWVIQRTTGLSPAQWRQLATDTDPIVRVHAIQALAECATWQREQEDLRPLVLAALQDEDAFVRRAAADALGRHPLPEQVAPLLQLWKSTPPEDTHLIHVVRMALRDHLLVPGVYAAAAELASREDAAQQLADVSLGAATGDSAQFLLAQLEANRLDAARLPEFVHHATRHLPEEQLPELFEVITRYEQLPTGSQREIVLALQRALQERGASLPEQARHWGVKLAGQLLAAPDEGTVRGGMELARELRLSELHESLAAIARGGTDHPPALRPTAIDACVAMDAARSLPLLTVLVADGNEPLDLRQKAAASLGGIGSPEAAEVLLTQLTAAPEPLAVEIATALAARQEAGQALLDLIASGKASGRLLQETAVQDRLRGAGIADLDARLAELTADLPAADERINQLLAARREGFQQTAASDAEQGVRIFEKHCAACHQLQGRGAKIGPELDGIGHRGLERILEDILDPSRNVDQAFRSTLLITTDGRVVSGLVLREEGQILVLADNQGKEVRVPVAEIDQRDVSSLSPMPANLAEQIPDADFNHLLRYLLNQSPQSPAVQP